MSNRFVDPAPQWVDVKGMPLSGGSVEFFITGSTTIHADTYADPAMTVTNPNPITLDTLGRSPVEIFLNPATSYRVVIKDATGTVFKTADPVVDPAMNRSAAIPIFTGGDPNGQVAGSAGDITGDGASCLFDTVNGLFWICSTTGTETTAVWTQVGAKLLGAVQMPTSITPAPLTGNVNNYSPDDLGGASKLRQDSTLAVRITGIAGGTSGRLLFYQNISVYEHTLVAESTSSTADNRFTIDSDLIVAPGKTLLLHYDDGTFRWQVVDPGNEFFQTRMISKEQVLSDGATIDWDMSQGPDATITLVASRTISHSNERAGAKGYLRVVQNATGGFILAFPGAFNFPGGILERANPNPGAQTVYSYRVVAAGNIQIKREYESVLPEYKCRAWVNLSAHTGTVAINGSGNISGVTRSGVGIFVITFANPMPDKYYSVSAIAQRYSTSSVDIICCLSEDTSYVPTENSVRIKVMDSAGGMLDPRILTVQVFR